MHTRAHSSAHHNTHHCVLKSLHPLVLCRPQEAFLQKSLLMLPPANRNILLILICVPLMHYKYTQRGGDGQYMATKTCEAEPECRERQVACPDWDSSLVKSLTPSREVTQDSRSQCDTFLARQGLKPRFLLIIQRVCVCVCLIVCVQEIVSGVTR